MKAAALAALLWLLCGVAHAQTGCDPNPNLTNACNAIVDGCPVPAATLNRCFGSGGGGGGGGSTYSILNFGGICDGFTLNDVAVASTLAASVAATGIAQMELVPGAVCAISNTIAITTSAVITCPAPVQSIPAGSAIVRTPSCGLIVQGSGTARGGYMMTIAAPIGSTTDGTISAPQIKGIKFDGAGVAYSGLGLFSVTRGNFEDLDFTGFNGGNAGAPGVGGAALNLDVVQGCKTGINFGMACDSQFNTFQRITVQQSDFTSAGIRLGGYVYKTGAPFIDQGGANSSANTFIDVFVFHGATNTGWLLWGADSNIFINTGANAPSFHVGTDLDLTFALAPDTGLGVASYPSNNNHFTRWFGNGLIYARGQTTLPSCIAYNTSLFGQPTTSVQTCTWGNRLDPTDASNGAFLPTTTNGGIEPGANFEANYDGELSIGTTIKLVSGMEPTTGTAYPSGDTAYPAQGLVDTPEDFTQCMAEMQQYGAYTSSFLCSASSGPLNYYDDLNGSRNIVRYNTIVPNGGSADLQHLQLTGTGWEAFSQKTEVAQLLLIENAAEYTAAQTRWSSLNCAAHCSLMLYNASDQALVIDDGTQPYDLYQNPTHQLTLVSEATGSAVLGAGSFIVQSNGTYFAASNGGIAQCSNCQAFLIETWHPKIALGFVIPAGAGYPVFIDFHEDGTDGANQNITGTGGSGGVISGELDVYTGEFVIFGAGASGVNAKLRLITRRQVVVVKIRAQS